jgi:pimeloyl-ACP methyl ester carboxylesterase
VKVYAISGLGANEKVFEKLKLPPGFELIFIPWLLPIEDDGIADYASRMAQFIDDSQEFILLGLSFGGLIAQEIARIKPPRKLLLFSTIKSDLEKPLWIRANRYLPLFKIFPYGLLNKSPLVYWVSSFRQWLKSGRPDIDLLYSMRDNRYTRWAFQQIVYWGGTEKLSCKVIHFHGTADFIFPIWNIHESIRIEGGGHLAIYEEAPQISRMMREILAW